MFSLIGKILKSIVAFPVAMSHYAARRVLANMFCCHLSEKINFQWTCVLPFFMNKAHSCIYIKKRLNVYITYTGSHVNWVNVVFSNQYSLFVSNVAYI